MLTLGMRVDDGNLVVGDRTWGGAFSLSTSFAGGGGSIYIKSVIVEFIYSFASKSALWLG